MKFREIALWRLTLALCVFSMPTFAETAPQFTVTGTGYSTGQPDLATITLGVTHLEKNAAEAMRKTSADTAKIFEELQKFNVAPKDMQTSQLSLNPQWSYRKSSVSGQDVNEITGFVASNMVTVRVRDLDNLGVVLDKIVTSGANDFRELSFGFAEPEPRQDEARVNAVKNAMQKAKLMAAAAGFELGKVLMMHESSNNRPPVMMARAEMAASDSVPVAAGEVSLSANVTITYEIVE